MSSATTQPRVVRGGLVRFGEVCGQVLEEAGGDAVELR
jgi:hypothetical protein